MKQSAQTSTVQQSSRGRRHSSGALLVQNEGSRSMRIIGEVVPDEHRVPPGCSLLIAVPRSSGPVQLTVYDGGLQIDYAVDSESRLPPDMVVQ